MDHTQPSASKPDGSRLAPAYPLTEEALRDAEAEAELFSRFEAELAAAECSAGCDYPDGPLAAQGCPW